MKYLQAMLLSAVLTLTFSLGITSFYQPTARAQEAVVQQSVSEVQEQQAASVVVSPEDSLKICKDEQGQAKVCEEKDLLSFLFLSMGGLKGASALAIAFFVAKLLLLLLLSPAMVTIFPKLAQGGWKLTAAVFMNLIVGVLSLMLPPVGLSLSAALTHSSVLALGSVFANQAFKQYLTVKGKS